MASVPTPPPQQPTPNPFPNQPQRQPTQPAFSVGIAAGAEDVKYQAKYKDLKRKVKEIEADNDKLHFKVLQAKRSIQRMKLERAVLYERLQQVPPSPELQDRHALPPLQPSPHQQAQQHHPPPPNHVSERPPASDYVRTHGGTLRQDSRAPMDSPMAPIHSSRRGSAGGPEPPRQLQFMQHMPPVQQQDLHRGHAPIHASPRTHERARSPSRSRGHPAPPVYHPHPQPYPDVQQAQHPLHSPPLSERSSHSRRHDIHELTARSIPPLSPSSDARGGAAAVHSHQRMGPGTYINREDFLEFQRERDRERERDWDQRERERERERSRARDAPMHSPASTHRGAPARPLLEYPPDPSRRRPEDPYLPVRRVYSPHSASPGSAHSRGSPSPAGDPPSRPDSRAQFFAEPERAGGAARSFRLRPVAQGEDVDFVHEDGRAQSLSRDRNGNGNGGGSGGGGGGGYAPEQSRPPPPDSRKRSRNDMDVDDDDGPPGAMYSRHSDAEPRGSKRYHPASDRM